MDFEVPNMKREHPPRVLSLHQLLLCINCSRDPCFYLHDADLKDMLRFFSLQKQCHSVEPKRNRKPCTNCGRFFKDLAAHKLNCKGEENDNIEDRSIPSTSGPSSSAQPNVGVIHQNSQPTLSTRNRDQGPRSSSSSRPKSAFSWLLAGF